MRVIKHISTHFLAGWLWVWLIACSLGVSTRWFTLNISSSVPLGLYRHMAIEGALHHGDIVLVPAVSFGRSWLASWLPLLKPVAGLPGENVCVQPEGLWVQGEYYGTVYQAHQGTPLPVFWGCHSVGEGEIFVASHQPKSLDGRYMGMTRLSTARRARPLWTR